MVTLSVPIDEARLAALKLRAAREGKLVEALILSAADDVLADEAEYLAAVQEGLDDIEAGRIVEADAVFDELRALLHSKP